jgi:hypothetical protein
MRRLSSVVLAFALSACERDATAPSPARLAPFDEVFSLRVGETARITGTAISLTFRRVAEDSRCPTSVVCVWEGNGRVVLRLAGGPAPLEAELNTSLEPTSASYGGHMIELLALDPYPETPDPIPEDRYRAALRVRAETHPWVP